VAIENTEANGKIMADEGVKWRGVDAGDD